MRSSRSGFSLMEVLLATSILLASSIALIELATIGRKQANAAYDLNQAQLLCQARLDEIAAGIAPAKPVESQQFEDHPEWFYSVAIDPLRFRQLVSVRVSVFQESRSSGRPVRFTLVRWMTEAIEPSRSESVPATASVPANNPVRQSNSTTREGNSTTREGRANRSFRTTGAEGPQ